MGDDIYSHLIVPKWIDYAFDKSKNNTILEKFVFLGLLLMLIMENI